MILEQLALLDGRRSHLPTESNWTSLLEVSEGLDIVIGATSTQDFNSIQALINSAPLEHRSKISVIRNDTLPRDTFATASMFMKRIYRADPTKFEGEYPTLRRLYDYCVSQVKRNRRALVYYFHNKGTHFTRS